VKGALAEKEAKKKKKRGEKKTGSKGRKRENGYTYLSA
jgi:hypothetical protein